MTATSEEPSSSVQAFVAPEAERPLSRGQRNQRAELAPRNSTDDDSSSRGLPPLIDASNDSPWTTAIATTSSSSSSQRQSEDDHQRLREGRDSNDEGFFDALPDEDDRALSTDNAKQIIDRKEKRPSSRSSSSSDATAYHTPESSARASPVTTSLSSAPSPVKDPLASADNRQLFQQRSSPPRPTFLAVVTGTTVNQPVAQGPFEKAASSPFTAAHDDDDSSDDAEEDASHDSADVSGHDDTEYDNEHGHREAKSPIDKIRGQLAANKNHQHDPYRQHHRTGAPAPSTSDGMRKMTMEHPKRTHPANATRLAAILDSEPPPGFPPRSTLSSIKATNPSSSFVAISPLHYAHPPQHPSHQYHTATSGQESSYPPHRALHPPTPLAHPSMPSLRPSWSLSTNQHPSTVLNHGSNMSTTISSRTSSYSISTSSNSSGAILGGESPRLRPLTLPGIVLATTDDGDGSRVLQADSVYEATRASLETLDSVAFKQSCLASVRAFLLERIFADHRLRFVCYGSFLVGTGLRDDSDLDLLAIAPHSPSSGSSRHSFFRTFEAALSTPDILEHGLLSYFQAQFHAQQKHCTVLAVRVTLARALIYAQVPIVKLNLELTLLSSSLSSYPFSSNCTGGSTSTGHHHFMTKDVKFDISFVSVPPGVPDLDIELLEQQLLDPHEGVSRQARLVQALHAIPDEIGHADTFAWEGFLASLNAYDLIINQSHLHQDCNNRHQIQDQPGRCGMQEALIPAIVYLKQWAKRRGLYATQQGSFHGIIVTMLAVKVALLLASHNDDVLCPQDIVRAFFAYYAGQYIDGTHNGQDGGNHICGLKGIDFVTPAPLVIDPRLQMQASATASSAAVHPRGNYYGPPQDKLYGPQIALCPGSRNRITRMPRSFATLLQRHFELAHQRLEAGISLLSELESVPSMGIVNALWRGPCRIRLTVTVLHSPLASPLTAKDITSYWDSQMYRLVHLLEGSSALYRTGTSDIAVTYQRLLGGDDKVAIVLYEHHGNADDQTVYDDWDDALDDVKETFVMTAILKQDLSPAEQQTLRSLIDTEVKSFLEIGKRISSKILQSSPLDPHDSPTMDSHSFMVEASYDVLILCTQPIDPPSLPAKQAETDAVSDPPRQGDAPASASSKPSEDFKSISVSDSINNSTSISTSNSIYCSDSTNSIRDSSAISTCMTEPFSSADSASLNESATPDSVNDAEVACEDILTNTGTISARKRQRKDHRRRRKNKNAVDNNKLPPSSS